MPYKSDAQRKFMHAKHPEIAKRWDAEYDSGGKLPAHVSQASMRRAALLRKMQQKAK